MITINTTARRNVKSIALKEYIKGLNIPQTIVVSDELYETCKDMFKDSKHITIMCASEMFLEKELVNKYIEDYSAGIGVLLEPKVFNPRDSFEHIRKQNDKRIFRVR